MTSCRYALLAAAMLVFVMAVSADAQQIVSGKDLTGWKHVGSGRFVIDDGVLRTEGGVGLLWCDGEKVGNSVLRVVYKVGSHTDNSGVFVRIPAPRAVRGCRSIRV